VVESTRCSVRKLKGIHDQIQRGQTGFLCFIEMVDCAFLFEEDIQSILEVLRPISGKGGDYLPERLPEKETVETHVGVIGCLNWNWVINFSIVDRNIKSAKTGCLRFLMVCVG
jgi:bifunctional ADP-heptose synthase (sugar kinase/adenylyltransferase)